MVCPLPSSGSKTLLEHHLLYVIHDLASHLLLFPCMTGLLVFLAVPALSGINKAFCKQGIEAKILTVQHSRGKHQPISFFNTLRLAGKFC